MTKIAKILVGLLTLSPLGIGAAILRLFLPMIEMMNTSAATNPPKGGNDAQVEAVLGMIPMTLLATGILVAVAFGVLVFYLINVYKSPTLSEQAKALWMVGLLFSHLVFPCSVLVMLAYFCLHIWPDNPPKGRAVTETSG